MHLELDAVEHVLVAVAHAQAAHLDHEVGGARRRRRGRLSLRFPPVVR
jgi:hypothetical protein